MILKILLAATGALALTSAAVLAQGAAPPSPHTATDSFAFKSDKDLKSLIVKPGQKGPVTGFLSDHEAYYTEVTGRTESGEPEFHAHWIDYMLVQDGHATLIHGGTNTGAHDTGLGELRGGTIKGGASQDINPGDYFEIPAGQWHQMMLKPGTKLFRYFVVKIRE